MNLLIITQKVDLDDDLLGFMHRWIEEIAGHCQNVIVICLWQGRYNLPDNVKVLSLGKEKKTPKFRYLTNFYRYIWRERKNYDCVFVHMNKEYILLGGIWWRLLNKKTALWYNHGEGNLWSSVAGRLAHKIFYTSPFSFFARSEFKKAQIMPAGIDTDFFRKQQSGPVSQNSLLFLGRISPVKNVDILIGAVNFLDQKNIDFVLNIAGEPGEKDRDYFTSIKNLARNLEERGKIRFLGKVPHHKTLSLYNQNEIFINLTNSGSLDKAILEAMACGQLVLVSNMAFESIFSNEWKKYLIFKENNARDLAGKIQALWLLNKLEKEKITQELRDIVFRDHGLDRLSEKIMIFFNRK